MMIMIEVRPTDEFDVWTVSACKRGVVIVNAIHDWLLATAQLLNKLDIVQSSLPSTADIYKVIYPDSAG